ncbi:plasma membrane fluoride export channel Fex2 [Schizosaccharomyces osmophilus]|uniref:Plasma membrane fluoride export channel Fex2 n=1 Tax=Schizosaccharomyces osmophilus TaxID=2545709 RepID=A0AAF0AVR8_9SCHI|nr:plasma membrane fluoride export channel Fex2 [Schizosaccharomyces osmophilus]WBW72753.1 plasma membrane fluoride export channel Fex2 [Schizosaccharomyces osmophilus]
MLGSLARLGLASLNTYPNTPFNGIVWAQVIGCIIMGFAQTETVFFPRPKHNAALLLAITTGFCGSLTTFSSWMLEMFTAMANLGPFIPRGRGDSFLAVVSTFTLTISMAFSGLLFGKQLGRSTTYWKIGEFSFARAIPMNTHLFVRGIIFLLAVGFFLGSSLYTAYTKDITHRGIGFSLIFSPFGAVLRLYLSRWFNSPKYYMPYGTLIANLLGTLIIAIMYMLPLITHCSPVSRSVIYGIQNGFCGCLTTLSTFLNELHTMPTKRAYSYCILSVAVGFSFCVIIDGATAWGHGYNMQS